MVEHFSKTVVLVPIRDKEPATVAEAFTTEVLTRYGAPAEVVTDRGGEFGGVFQEGLDASSVDHRATSAYHSQANDLSERIVQVVKRALRKWCLGHPAEEWDVYLPWVAMGYNFSMQAAQGGFSPYQLLHGRAPVVPGTVRAAVAEPLNLDNEAIFWSAGTGEAGVVQAVDAHGDGQPADCAVPGHPLVRSHLERGMDLIEGGAVRGGRLRVSAA
jgi:hypothetical protein